MRLFETRQAGDRVAHGTHHGINFEVIVGNDIKHTTFFGRTKVLRTLITRSKVDKKTLYATYVIRPRFFKSKLNSKRIKEAIESWKDNLDYYLITKSGLKMEVL